MHMEVFEKLAQRLEGRIVVLEPLGPEHVEGLRAAAADERIWTWMVTLDPEEWIADALRDGSRQPFAILQDGVVIGSSSYMSLAPEHLRLEIGSTWMHPVHLEHRRERRGEVPPARGTPSRCVGCRRVEFKTDALNDAGARRPGRAARPSSRASTASTCSCAAASAAIPPGTP